MRHLFSTPLGQEIAPKATFKKSWVGSAIGAVGSLAGGLLNNQANANLNKTNRDWQTARDYTNFQRQKQLFDYENAYNTPLEQRKRLQEAGFNPWISGSGGYSNTGQIPSAPAMSGAPSSIPMQDVVSPAVQNGVNTYLGAANMQANVANQNADTSIKLAKAYTDMLKAGADKDKAYEWWSSQMKSLGFTDKIVSDLNTSINQDYLSSKIANDRASVEYFLLNKYGDKQGQLEVDKLQKDIDHVTQLIDVAKSQKNLNEASIKKLAEEARYYLEKWTTESETRDYVKSILDGEAQMWKNNQTGNSWLGADNWFIKLLNTISQTIGIALGGSVNVGVSSSKSHVTRD